MLMPNSMIGVATHLGDEYMNPKLEEVDQLYQQIEWYFEPDLLDPKVRIDEVQRGKEKEKDKLYQIYNQAANKIDEVAPTLSPDEIIDGFLHASKILHRNLSGYMISKELFDEAFIPVMIQAIKDDNSQPLYGFLLTLSKILDEAKVIELVSIGLNSQYYRMKITACGIAERNKFVQFAAKIRRLLNDEPIWVVDAAKGALEVLEGEK